MIAFVIDEEPLARMPLEMLHFAPFQPLSTSAAARPLQQKYIIGSCALFATSDDDFIRCPMSETGLSPRSNTRPTIG
ncbi:hypothetical protein [Rhizobium tubonense]|uniref:hypothetical protein n=1 Tax=Rhizobium tubonense TaxID=484088 RepID=UPI0011B59A01|nr:hypothetical protein [Rhizobium tubonense]